MSSTNVAVSIIMPVFNSEKYLQEAIDSVLAQTCRNWELIIIDDGSTDQSGSICDTYVQRDSRIRAVHTENRGVSSARNAGIDLAKGEWIVFMDSDDMMRPRMLEVLLSYADGVDLVNCAVTLFPENRACLDMERVVCYTSLQETTNDLARLFRSNFYSAPWNKLYKRSKMTMRFDPQVSLSEDVCFNLEYMNHCERICSIPDVLYIYRTSTENSLTKKVRRNLIENRAHLFHCRLRYLGDTSAVRDMASRDFFEWVMNHALALARSKWYSLREKYAILSHWAKNEFWHSGELNFDAAFNKRHRLIMELFRRRQSWAVLILCMLYAAKMDRKPRAHSASPH